MSVYTRVGSGIWSWDRFTALDPTVRCFWLGLYTSGEAKRLVPGLFQGSITGMADATRLPADTALTCLDKLLEHELVEYDTKLRVLRLTELPDPGESPLTGNVIRGWFSRFRSVPQCAVRDAHVTTLKWILEEWQRETGKVISADHQKAWSETFSKIVIPSPRKRGVRRLVDSDTGSSVQPGLFESLSAPAVHHAESDFVSKGHLIDGLSNTATLEYIGDVTSMFQDQDQGSRSRSKDQDQGQVPDPDPDTTSRAKPALALVPSMDDVAVQLGTIARAIGQKHVLEFARVKAELGSTAWGPGPADSFTELRELLAGMGSLQDAQAKCEYALAVRAAEASHRKTMAWFGNSMWKRQNFDNAIAREIAEVDGSKTPPGAPTGGGKSNAFAAADAVFLEMAAKENQT